MANGPPGLPFPQIQQAGLVGATPPPLPGGFAPGSLGLFGGGTFQPVNFERDTKRTRKILERRKTNFANMAKAAGVELSPELAQAGEGLIRANANRAAQAALIQTVAETQRRRQAQERGVEQAITAIQGATGVSRQGIQLGRGFDPQLEPLIQGIAQGDPAAQLALEGLAEQAPRAQAARQTGVDILEAQLLSAQREGANKLLTREGNFRKEFRQALGVGMEIVTTAAQLDELLTTDTPLAALGTVVKLARLLDPESVVREGEVTTVAGGTGTAAAMITALNKYVNRGLSEDARQEFMGVINALVIPEARRAQRLFSDFTSLADRAQIPVDVALAGTGIDRAFLDRLASGAVFGTDFSELN